MRPARALCPPRLAVLVLLALTSTTSGYYRGSLICKQPETQVCLTWLVYSEELQNFKNAENLSTRTRDNCGFSKLRDLSPYQKFHKVSQLNKIKTQKTLHCKRIVLIGLFVDWEEIGNALGSTVRVRRQTFTPKGRYRGQTQSQYLAIDRGNGKDEGKAEAHSAADSSRASVSGNSGMGQAQSQTIYDPNCEDCYGRPQVDAENLKHPGSTWPSANHGQGDYIPSQARYNPRSPGSQGSGFYDPKSNTNVYEGSGPNDKVNYRPSGINDRPTTNNGNMVPNDLYEPNNIGEYDMKNVPSNYYNTRGNVERNRPKGSGTNGYSPYGNGVYDPEEVVPNINKVENDYSSGFPKQGGGLTPGDSRVGGVYGPQGRNRNTLAPGGQGQGAEPDQEQEVGPDRGNRVGPGQGHGIGPSYGQGVGPGQEQEVGPGRGQGGRPGQGQGEGPGYGQGGRPGQGQGEGPGYGVGPDQVQGVRPGYGQGVRPGYEQGVGPDQEGVRPGYGQGVGPGHGQRVRPGYGQGVGPDQGVRTGYGIGPGHGQGVRPGYGQGVGPGQEQEVGPGLEQGGRPGQGQGEGPGYGQGGRPGQGSVVGPGYEQGVGPDQGQGVRPGYGQGVRPGYEQGVGPDQGQGVRPGYGQGVGPGHGSGLGPGYGQGVVPGREQEVGPSRELGGRPGQGQGEGQGYGQEVRPGQGSEVRPGYVQGVGPVQGQGVRPGYGQGIGPDHGQGVRPGYGQGVRPGQESGLEPGYEPGVRPGYEQGVGPDQRGVQPGYEQGVRPGYEQGVGPDQRQGVRPGYGQGVGPGHSLGVGPGHGQGLRPGQGSEVGPGYGQGVRPDYDQGVGPDQGQGVHPGYGQGVGPGRGSGVGPDYGQGAGPGQGSEEGPGYGQDVRPGQGSEVVPGYGQEVGPGQGKGVRPNQGQGVGPDQGQSAEPGYGKDLRPVQGTGPINTGSNWPMASGPYAGPGGSNYYCCFVPNTGSKTNLQPNRNPNLDGQLESGVNRPNLVTNPYGNDNPQAVGSMKTVPADGNFGKDAPNSGSQYRPSGSGSTLTQPSQYDAEFNPLKPGRQVATGISKGPNKNLGNQYDPLLTTGMQPSNYGTGIDHMRPFSPDGQSGTGVSNGPVRSPYGPVVSTGSSPSIPADRFSSNGGNLPHQQYGTFKENNGALPPREGNTGFYDRQPSSVNQYNTGNNGDNKGQFNEPNTSIQRFGTGTATSQNMPSTSVGNGDYIGQHGPGIKHNPVDNSGLTLPGQQYGTGSDGLSTSPAGKRPLTDVVQNGPLDVDTVNYPLSPHGSGSLGRPEKTYGLGTTGPNSPTGYPGGPNVQDRENAPSYGSGNLNYNSNTPGGTYHGGNVGGENADINNGPNSRNNNQKGTPIDGTSGSQYGPYNQGGFGVQNNEYSGGPQNFIDPNSIDGDDSQAEASVAQGINGTIASASSKGGNDKGRAQTNVHGTYTGSGSFQAQAQITGDNKEAQSEVSGGKKGASSSASGSGRNNKSQASVQLGSETGSVQTQSQSAGVMHSSNSQVQGSVKGGMADAQAKGPGSTSSQAQIGFTPYKDKDKSNHDLLKTPFSGGGVASAQSSGRTGQSQSQLHGTFKYGIRYNGAAQSGASLDKDAVFPNRLSFEKIDVFDENEKNVNVDMTENPPSLSTEQEPNIEPSTSESYNVANEEELTTTENVLDDTIINSEGFHTHLDHHKTDNLYLSSPTLSGTKKSFLTNRKNNPGTEYEYSTVKEELPPDSDYDTDEPYNAEGSEESELVQGEYSNYDEFTKETPTHQSLLSSNRKPLEVRQTTGGNTQHIVLGSLKNHNARIVQKDSDRPDENKVYQAGERIPGTGGYTVPAGFTGSVKSVASRDNTYAVGYRDSPSQAQTVTLTPGTGKVKYMYPPAYGKHVMPKNLRSLYSPRDDNKYLSVSKSVTRALDNENNIRKQYSHTYYTKSSSCGYFTFTCTMVSSAEGRKKVCKPKIPTNPDGTQIRC